MFIGVTQYGKKTHLSNNRSFNSNRNRTLSYSICQSDLELQDSINFTSVFDIEKALCKRCLWKCFVEMIQQDTAFLERMVLGYIYIHRENEKQKSA